MGIRLREIEEDFVLRGIGWGRRTIFRCRIEALAMLLANTRDKGMCIPANLWNARRISQMPPQVWSPEQDEVLNAVSAGVAVEDANVVAHSDTCNACVRSWSTQTMEARQCRPEFAKVEAELRSQLRQEQQLRDVGALEYKSSLEDSAAESCPRLSNKFSKRCQVQAADQFERPLCGFGPFRKGQQGLQHVRPTACNK